jgi:hypothetical protein
MYREVVAGLDQNRGGDGVFRLEFSGGRYEITAERYAVDTDDGRPALRGVRVVEWSGGTEPMRRINAGRATVELRSGLDRDRPVIIVTLLENVEIRRGAARPGERVVRKDRESLQPVQLLDQSRLRQRIDAVDLVSLLDAGTQFGLYPQQERLRSKAIERLAEFRSKVLGEIHFRASYTLGSVALVLLGAVLGIIVRGGQVLTAFGISCIPMLFVVVASVVGRNLADRPAYTLVSICVMWGATAFLYVATAAVTLVWLKR